MIPTEARLEWWQTRLRPDWPEKPDWGIPTGARLSNSRLGKIPTGHSRLGPIPDWARLGNPDWSPTGANPRLGDPDWIPTESRPDPTELPSPTEETRLEPDLD